MNITRKQSRRGGQFDKKLAAYTLAGAAALIIPGAARADIVYVGNVDQTINNPGSYDFNLSGLSSDDITITADTAEGFPEVTASTANGAEVLLDSSSTDVTALAFGALIDPTNPPSGTGWGSSGKMASSFPLEPGDWSSTGGSSYLGFYFQGPDGPQAGWADIATTTSTPSLPGATSSFEILSYAYETDANIPITAGEGSPVPEPYALPLLALGGVGLIALRRRRAANA
jgi:hypothetical protein